MFQTAVKHEAKLRLAIAGPSGSGKTYTALTIASNLSEKVALVDTEHGSASKYADIFHFDVMEIQPPFDPTRFGNAVLEAQEAGYDVVILDSLSHAWNGTGGLLEMVDKFSMKYKGNTFAGWKEGTPVYNRLIDTIVQSSIHVIATMRSKQDYVLDIGEDGKQRPKKVGMAPIQRDGFEYEFDVFLEMDIDNIGRVVKTRCPALTGKAFKLPGRDMADILVDWLKGAPKTDQAVTEASRAMGRSEELQPQTELEPAAATSKDSRVWTRAQMDALILNELAENDFGASAMLGLSMLPAEATASEITAWGKVYREARGAFVDDQGKRRAKMKPAEAAAVANDKIFGEPHF